METYLKTKYILKFYWCEKVKVFSGICVHPLQTTHYEWYIKTDNLPHIHWIIPYRREGGPQGLGVLQWAQWVPYHLQAMVLWSVAASARFTSALQFFLGFLYHSALDSSLVLFLANFLNPPGQWIGQTCRYCQHIWGFTVWWHGSTQPWRVSSWTSPWSSPWPGLGGPW